jgi:hypothetical protein
LHNKNIFDIGIVTPTEDIKIFSFGEDQRHAKKSSEGRVHEMCNQSKFGSLSFRPTNLVQIKQINMYKKIGTYDIVGHCK